MKTNYLTLTEKQALKELINILKEKFGDRLRAIKLFGSKVRGDFDEASDIDIFIQFDGEVDWRFKDDIYSLIFEIDLKYDVFISARIYATEKLKDNKIQELPFIKNISVHGVTLL